MPSYYLFSYLSHFFVVLAFLPLVHTRSRYHNPPYLLYTPEAMPQSTLFSAHN